MARAASGHFSARRTAPVAQLDRAPDYESGGQEFESLRARHFYYLKSANGTGFLQGEHQDCKWLRIRWAFSMAVDLALPSGGILTQ